MKVLNLFIDSNDEELMNKYKLAADKHNHKVMTDKYADSGFDLFAPELLCIFSEPIETILYNYKIKCSMYENDNPCAYYLYPRSSIYKTSLRLANSVGIIDSGYRGYICAVFDCLKSTSINKYDRYVQLCAPDLKPFIVNIIVYESMLSQTERNEGGFGSTGL